MQEQKSWYYTDEFVNPEEGMRTAFSMVPLGFSSVKGAVTIRSTYVAVQQDIKENLHSLVQPNVCSCGLAIDSTRDPRLLAIVLTPQHRNHATLEHEPYPAFRGKVSSRLSYQDEDPRQKADIKWNLIVDAIESSAVEEQLDFTSEVEVMPVKIHTHPFWLIKCYICLEWISQPRKTADICNTIQEFHLKEHLLIQQP
jgi:hypothetical protein